MRANLLSFVRAAQPPYIGPVADPHTLHRVILCATCDADHAAVVAEVGPDARERDCLVDWLTGSQLSGDRATCFCFESDPFPNEDFPEVRPNERRYFHYYEIAKLLGVTGKKNRAKLPACVTKKIAQMYPDEEGTPTKMGYQQEAA